MNRTPFLNPSLIRFAAGLAGAAATLAAVLVLTNNAAGML